MSKFTHTAESRPLDGYTIKRPLHRGGFGEVYFAVTDGGRDVALKLLKENVEVELRGVQQCLNLSHPNLVTIFDVKQDGDGDYWIVMEFVPGETLDDVLRRSNQPMPMQEVLRWMRAICAGVSHLHDRGIVHRDLKPSNIFGAEGVVKVGDIGLSKFITASRRSAHTESVGTVYYMAPEISRGRYGNEVDIYAIGVIAYEMLTGKIPFDGESAGEILMKHLTTPPNLSLLPERLRPVIHRALAKDPGRRPSSVMEFLREFEAAVVGRATPPRTTPAASRRPMAPRSTTQNDGETRSRGHYPPAWIIGGLILFILLGRVLGPVEMVIITVVLITYAFTTRDVPRDIGRVAGHWKRRLSGHRPDRSQDAWPVAHEGRSTPREFVSQDVWITDSAETPAPDRTNSVRPAAPWYGHWSVLVAVLWAGIFVIRNGVAPAIVIMGAGLTLAMIAFITKTLQFGWEVLLSPSTARPVRPMAAALAGGQRSPLIPIRTNRERLNSLVTSGFFVPVATTTMTAAVAMVRPDILQLSHGISVATIFLSIVTVGTWLISLIAAMGEGQDWDKWTRRGMFGAGGLMTGGVGYAIWQSLFAPGARILNSAGQDAAFAHFGSHALTTGDHTPTLAGFLCFFGVFFALINWTKQASPLRSTRLGLWPLMASVIVGGLTSQILEFPVGLAVLSSGVISAAVQLTSPGTSPTRRQS